MDYEPTPDEIEAATLAVQMSPAADEIHTDGIVGAIVLIALRAAAEVRAAAEKK